MKLIKPYFEILEQKDLFQHIELCGRTAYKSENKTTKASAKPFVDMIINKKHTAVLEHGTVYLNIPPEEWKVADNYKANKYSVVRLGTTFYYTTTNYRVLVENGWLDDLKYMCEPTEFHERRISVKFVCDRGILAEFTRHRVFSFVAESTRFCNYSKDKFGNELTFIIPCWITDLEERFDKEYHHTMNDNNKKWFDLCIDVEQVYNDMIKEGWKPQQARSVLPNSLKTELIMTGTIEQWNGFFNLRCATDAHPQARELAISLQDEFKRLSLIK